MPVGETADMACPLAPVFLWSFMDGSIWEVFHGCVCYCSKARIVFECVQGMGVCLVWLIGYTSKCIGFDTPLLE